VLVTFYLIETSLVFFSSCNLSNLLLRPNHVASRWVSGTPEYEVLSDAFFSRSTTIQIFSHGNVLSEHFSNTATTQCLDSFVHLVSDTSMDVIPADNLGVLLCCALETETNTSIAQELDVQNNVMCQIGSNPDFTIFLFSFRLFSLLSSPLESKSTSTMYQNSLLVNIVENAAEDHNVGVWVVTFLLDLLHLFELVMFMSIRCACIVICHILMHFTPCSKFWPPYIHRLNLLTISCCFLSLRTVFEKCRRLKAIILRSLFRRCDFVVFYVMFCKVQRFTIFFVLASQLFMMLPTLGKQNIVDICEKGFHYLTLMSFSLM